MELEGKELVIAHIPPNNGTLYQAGGVCWIRRGTFTVPLTVPEIEEFLEVLRKQGSLTAIEQKHGGRYYRL